MCFNLAHVYGQFSSLDVVPTSGALIKLVTEREAHKSRDVSGPATHSPRCNEFDVD